MQSVPDPNGRSVVFSRATWGLSGLPLGRANVGAALSARTCSTGGDEQGEAGELDGQPETQDGEGVAQVQQGDAEAGP